MRKNTSPEAIAAELGERLRQARLNANLTQSAVAQRAGINRKAVVNAEKGKGQLISFVAILTALDLANQLNTFLPEQPLSPLQLARLQGAKRQRASGNNKVDAGEPMEW